MPAAPHPLNFNVYKQNSHLLLLGTDTGSRIMGTSLACAAAHRNCRLAGARFASQTSKDACAHRAQGGAHA
eukprot:scaffold24903_cov17-Tisochrysis_lutea.AAC.1